MVSHPIYAFLISVKSMPFWANVFFNLLFLCINFIVTGFQRLPPLSTEPNRCEKAFVGNTIGQANGVYDKPIDLRFCDYTNDKSNLKGKSLAAALMSDAKFDGADMSEVVMSKAYAVGASFKGNYGIPALYLVIEFVYLWAELADLVCLDLLYC